MGAARAKKVGYSGQVAEDVVAVEASEREELLQHLQMREGDDQQQGPGGGGGVQGEDEDQVEVQAAEVGAEPARAAEPVGVGDIGEEGRPDQVDARADPAGPGTAVTARGRVPAFVEGGGRQGQGEDDEEPHRVAQDLPEADGQSARGEQPVVDRGDDRADGGHDGPAEQWPHEHADGVRGVLGEQHRNGGFGGHWSTGPRIWCTLFSVRAVRSSPYSILSGQSTPGNRR